MHFDVQDLMKYKETKLDMQCVLFGVIIFEVMSLYLQLMIISIMMHAKSQRKRLENVYAAGLICLTTQVAVFCTPIMVA
jgi:hypothetical protein